MVHIAEEIFTRYAPGPCSKIPEPSAPGQPPREARLALDGADFGRYNARGEGAAALPPAPEFRRPRQHPPAPKIRAVKGGGRAAGA
jgi:hypothetical protein